jgi:hypothetical protein
MATLVKYLYITLNMIAKPYFYVVEGSEYDCQCKTHAKAQASKEEESDGIKSVLPQSIGFWNQSASGG